MLCRKGVFAYQVKEENGLLILLPEGSIPSLFGMSTQSDHYDPPQNAMKPRRVRYQDVQKQLHWKRRERIFGVRRVEFLILEGNSF
ncbi:hypothetical protein RRG08_004307 [Elysia crispata]|uniref:Uncharacterized protein n=1 Tax=Elysia crispata TaxID=231223 RepID=A0AAE0YCV0_9GAST|nr:hypothetical protein RRG08_004307 [Elysia crispata]